MLFVNIFLLAVSVVVAYNDVCVRSQEETCGVQDDKLRHTSSLIQRGRPTRKKSSLVATSKKPQDDLDESLGFDVDADDLEKSLQKELESMSDQTNNDEAMDKQLEEEVEAELSKMGIQDEKDKSKSKSRKKSKEIAKPASSDGEKTSKGVLAWMSDALGGSSSQKDKSDLIREEMAKESAEIAASREREAVATQKVAQLKKAMNNVKKEANKAKKQNSEKQPENDDDAAVVSQAPLQQAGVPGAAAVMADTTAVAEDLRDELAKQVADLKKEVTAQVAHVATQKLQKEFAKVHASESSKESNTDERTESSKSSEKAESKEQATADLAKELSNQIKKDRQEVVKEVAKQMKQLLPSKQDAEKNDDSAKQQASPSKQSDDEVASESDLSSAGEKAAEEESTAAEGQSEKEANEEKKGKQEKDGKEEKGKKAKKEKAQPEVSKEAQKHVTHMVQQEMGMHNLGGSMGDKRTDRPMTVEEALEFEAAQQENIQAKGTYEDRLNKKKMGTSVPKGTRKQDKKKRRQEETKNKKSKKKSKSHKGRKRPKDNSMDTSEDSSKGTSKESAKSTTYEDMLSKIKMDMYNSDKDGKKKAQADLEKLLDPEGERSTNKFDDLFGDEDKKTNGKKKGKGSGKENDQSFAPAPPPDIPLTPGQNVTLDEEGYRIVLEQVSDPEMEIFIRRVIGELGLTVRDEGKFKGMVPYYSGRAANQTFNSLVGEITQAVARRCGWVGRLLDMDLDGSTAPMDEKGYTEVAQLHSGTQMKKYITRVIDSMNYKVLDQAGLNKIIPAHSCEAETQTLQALRAEIKAAARQPGKSWVGWQRQQEEVS